MPITLYDEKPVPVVKFRCLKCGYVDERIAGADSFTADCLSCGAQMTRLGPVNYENYFPVLGYLRKGLEGNKK